MRRDDDRWKVAKQIYIIDYCRGPKMEQSTILYTLIRQMMMMMMLESSVAELIIIICQWMVAVAIIGLEIKVIIILRPNCKCKTLCGFSLSGMGGQGFG